MAQEGRGAGAPDRSQRAAFGQQVCAKRQIGFGEQVSAVHAANDQPRRCKGLGRIDIYLHRIAAAWVGGAGLRQWFAGDDFGANLGVMTRKTLLSCDFSQPPTVSQGRQIATRRAAAEIEATSVCLSCGAIPFAVGIAQPCRFSAIADTLSKRVAQRPPHFALGNPELDPS